MLRNPLIEKNTIYSEHLKEMIVNLDEWVFQIPDEFEYRVIEVTEDYVARPDLVSYQFYGSDLHQDIICKINGISNPFELNEGELLVVPVPQDIYKFYRDSSIDQNTKVYGNISGNNTGEDSDTMEASAKPKAKTKQDKRKANDALINDERFRIDTNRRVVIY